MWIYPISITNVVNRILINRLLCYKINRCLLENISVIINYYELAGTIFEKEMYNQYSVHKENKSLLIPNLRTESRFFQAILIYDRNYQCNQCGPLMYNIILLN